jgi:2-iminobutanoate/2-iminopropanoate deaminase
MFISPMRLPEIRKRIHEQRRIPMKYEIVQSPEVHEPMGRGYAGMPIYSQAFSIDLKSFDRLVIIAGQVPLDKQGNVVNGDLADQFHQVFRNLKATVEAARGKMENIISLRTLLSREDDLPIFHRLRGEFYPQLFGGKPLPPNTLLVVKQLVLPEIRLEIEAIAAI